MRMAALQPPSESDRTVSREMTSANEGSSAYEFELTQNSRERSLSLMGMIEPPVIPENLTPGQAAQLCEILEYLQARLQVLIDSAEIDEASGQVQLPLISWQRLLDAQARLAGLVRRVADPEWPN